MTDTEQNMIYYMSRFTGQKRYMWDVVNELTDILSGMDESKKRSDIRKEVRLATQSLIKQGILVRYQTNVCVIDGKRKRLNLIRINESFVE